MKCRENAERQRKGRWRADQRLRKGSENEPTAASSKQQAASSKRTKGGPPTHRLQDGQELRSLPDPNCFVSLSHIAWEENDGRMRMWMRRRGAGEKKR